MNTLKNTSERLAALVSGWSIVIMAIVAGLILGLIMENLIVADDPAATFDNIKASEGLFRVGIFGWIVILITDLLAAWGLYVYLKQVNENLSLLTAWLRFLYATILGIAILNYAFVLILISGESYLESLGIDHIQAQLMFFLDGFTGIWSIGLIVFGLHLLGLGYLALKSNIPKIISVLILIAGFGYLIIQGGYLLFVQFDAYKATLETIFMIPMIFGEVGLAIWLLIKGGKANLA